MQYLPSVHRVPLSGMGELLCIVPYLGSEFFGVAVYVR
jgi:hypothetical protein